MPTYDRYRSEGTNGSGLSVGCHRVERQAMLNYGGSRTYRLFGSADYNGTGSHDDRQGMFDCLGSRRWYYPVLHRKRFDFPVDVPPLAYAANTPTMPDSWFGSYGVYKTYGYQITPNGRRTSASFHSLFDKADSYFLSGNEDEPDWADLVDQVGVTLDGRMGVGQNLLVSLMQLTQTVGMIKNPFGARKLARAIGKKSPLSKALKLGSSAYLEYKFGWENLYRDVKAIADVWSEVRQHKEYLQKRVNTVVSNAARDSATTQLNTLGPHALNNSSYCKLLPYLRKRVTTCCFSLDMRLTQAMCAWSTWDQVLARLGTRELAEALWDLVPYSFVVDWFTHINRAIRQDPIAWHNYDLRRIGYSKSIQLFGEIDYSSSVSSYGQGTVSVSKTLGPCVIEKFYERIPGFPPDTSSVGLFGNLNKTQIAEGLALIVQRI